MSARTAAPLCFELNSSRAADDSCAIGEHVLAFLDRRQLLDRRRADRDDPFAKLLPAHRNDEHRRAQKLLRTPAFGDLLRRLARAAFAFADELIDLRERNQHHERKCRDAEHLERCALKRSYHFLPS